MFGVLVIDDRPDVDRAKLDRLASGGEALQEFPGVGPTVGQASNDLSGVVRIPQSAP
jgi:hypothetical protein